MIELVGTILQQKVSRFNFYITILILLYSVGIFGIVTNIHPYFILLTPINLLISTGIVLRFHPSWNQVSAIFLLLAYLVGFSAEVYGVQTGRLFGSYVYGTVLGPKIWGTPLIIGVNWMLLTYSIGVTTNRLLPKWNWLLKGFVAALLLVGLDVLIEPVAVRCGFWSWAQGTPPLQNYIGWFCVSLPLLCIFALVQGEIRNKVAIVLFLLQVLFFTVLNIV